MGLPIDNVSGLVKSFGNKAIAGVTKRNYVVDLTNRLKIQEGYDFNSQSIRDSFWWTVSNWSTSIPLNSMFIVYINEFPMDILGFKDEHMFDYLVKLDLLNKENSKLMDGQFLNVYEIAKELINKSSLFNKMGSFTKYSSDNHRELMYSNGLTSAFLKAIDSASSGSSIGQIKASSALISLYSMFGAKLANKISNLPNETIGGLTRPSSNVNNGSLGGYTSKNRKEPSKIKIEWKENNLSLCDFVYRPWIRYLDLNGLVKLPGQYQKYSTDIEIVQYTRTTNKYEIGKDSSSLSSQILDTVTPPNYEPLMIPFKHWVFFDLFPTDVDTRTLTYTDNQEIGVSNVTFAYRDYVCTNYGAIGKGMSFKPLKADSFLNRFIPAEATLLADSIGGTGTMDSIVNLSLI